MDYGVLIALGSPLLTSVLVALIVGGGWALGRQHERCNFLARSGGLEDTAARMERMVCHDLISPVLSATAFPSCPTTATLSWF